MKKLLCSSLLIPLAIGITPSSLHAQSYKLKQVIVLNDGNREAVTNGFYTTVGSYDPVTKVYQNFDTIHTDYGSHVIIDSGFIYVGADSLLIKYDLNTKAKIATQTVPGLREIAVWGNQILVTRGATFSLNSYFQSYDKSNLHLKYDITTVSYAAEGIQVTNDSAYIAINDYGSGGVGKIGVIDLKGQTEKHEVDLGATGLNPYSVFVEPSNQEIFTVNDLNWTNSSVTLYNSHTAAFNNNSLHLSSGCTGSVYYQGNVYFQAGNDANVGLFNTSSLTVWDSLKINKYIYGMGIDSADGYIYLGQTDYYSYGNVFIYDLFGHPIDSFAVDIGPGNFAFDIRNVTGIPEVAKPINVNIYPNPATDNVTIALERNITVKSLSLTDELGKTIFNKPVNAFKNSMVLNMSNYTSGVYFITIQTSDGNFIHNKIIKQ